MKKIISVVLIFSIMCSLLVSCDEATRYLLTSYSDNNSGNNSATNIKPDNMVIYQGFSSYAYLSSDRKITEELYEYVTSLEYEKISNERAEEESDLLTQISIYFAQGEKNVLKFHIDKIGILWFETYEDGILIESCNNPEIQYYKITGNYSYDYIYSIYASQRKDNIEVYKPDKPFSFVDIPYGTVIWNDYMFPFPKPKADRFEMTLDGGSTLYCYGMNSDDTEAFRTALIHDDWQLCSDTYIKGNQTLRFTDQSFFPENEGGGHIRINYRAGYEGISRTGGITKDDALPLIRSVIDTSSYTYIESPSTFEQGKDVSVVVELDVPDAFEKAQIQIFAAYGKNNYFGTFIYSHGKILRTSFDCFSNDAFSSVCVADIDNDGRYELISMFGSGSGIWRMHITAYKFGNPPEFNSLNEVVYSAYSATWYSIGFATLRLVQISDTEVKLFGTEIGKNGEVSLSEDYGLLKTEGSKFIVAEKNKFRNKFLINETSAD